MRRVLYLTDVEGMWPRLASFCAPGDGVRLDPTGRLDVDSDTLLVFGGDAVDRGPDSRRVVRALLDAKERWPDRVVLLAGNRDLNKMRLRAELGADPRADRLRDIFTRTMGARAAFEHRRTELARESGGAGNAVGAIDDDAVVASYLEEARPGGALARYLSACQLAFRFGRALFVHGGVTSENLGFVPGRPRVAGDDVDGWIASLDVFYRDQVAAFADGGPPEAYEPLVAYQRPARGGSTNPTSVVYVRTADEHNNLELPGEDVIAALARAGVDRVVAGHTPNGDSPSPARDGAFAIVIADNSHARIDTASRVEVHEDGTIQADARVLVGGSPEPVRFTLPAGAAAVDSPIGLRVEDEGALVKGELSSGDLLLYRALPGYETDERGVARDWLAARRLVTARRAR